MKLLNWLRPQISVNLIGKYRFSYYENRQQDSQQVKDNFRASINGLPIFCHIQTQHDNTITFIKDGIETPGAKILAIWPITGSFTNFIFYVDEAYYAGEITNIRDELLDHSYFQRYISRCDLLLANLVYRIVDNHSQI